ncbi:MAG: phenylacetate--CoA ligase PaaK [Myxococcota bacterium]
MPQPIPADAQLTEIERADVDALRAVQLERLRWTLQHAYANVPHYKNALDAAGVHPDDLKSLEDLKKFPFTSKEDLRRNYPFGMFAVPREQVVRVHASSGTTGQPTVVGYTRADLDMWADVMARSLRAAGARPGDVVHVAYGYGLFTGGLGAHYGAERLGCTVVPVSGGQSERQVRLIRDFAPRVLLCTPSYALALADEFERLGYDPADNNLNVGIFGAEPWTDAVRQEIEARFDLHAVDVYGLSEVVGPGVANELWSEKDGAYVWEDHFYPEVIDQETLEPVADGETGELVFTSLTKQAFPIIRYRTRDLTRLVPGVSFPMRKMKKVTGRTDDMMIVRGVNVFPSQIEEILVGIDGLAPHYVIELTRDGALDTMTVKVERRGGVDASSDALLAAELKKKVRDNVGLGCEVSIEGPRAIERSMGKAKRVFDRRS